MSGTARTLLLAPEGPDRPVLAELLAAAFGPAPTVLDDALGFAEHYAAGRFDLAVVADGLGWAAPLGVLAMLRASRPRLPVVLWLAEATAADVVAAWRDGAAGVCLQPSEGVLALRDTVVAVWAARTQAPLADASPVFAGLDHAGIGAFATDAHGALSQANPAMARIAPGVAAVGVDPLARLVPPEELPQLRKQLSQVGWVHNERMAVPGEPGRWISLTVHRGPEGCVGLVGDASETEALGRELTDARYAADQARTECEAHRVELVQLRAAGAEGKLLVQGLAHDLGEPLRSLGYQLDEVEERFAGTEAGEALDACRRSLGRIQDMIRDQLAPHPGVVLAPGGDAPTGRCALDQVLAEAQANLQATIAKSGAVLVTDPLPEVAAAAPQMLQVLQNLVANAIRHHKGAVPHITVQAQKIDREWVIRVHDDGPGIPLALRQRVFEPHWKGEHSTGSGIGLAVCRTILSRLGGHLWVADDPRPGTTMCFSVPAIDETQEPTERAPSLELLRNL